MALAGQTALGPYRLLRVIKTGQTSQVWSAINDLNQERVAVKVLLSDFRQNREHRAFLKNEYEVGKRLAHPSIIRMIDYNVISGVPFLVMEHFDYPNMKDIINKVLDQVGWLLPNVIQRAGEAVAHMGDAGWVHRDIKPDNFLVNIEGEVKLIDFALAQRAQSGLARLLPTRRKKVQGTVSYMSPEQVLGKPLTPASDVYSFACTVFHLLTGNVPFTGSTANEVLNKHLKAPPPSIEAYNRNITPEFGALLAAMMAKRPQDRPGPLSKVLREMKAIRLYKVPPKPPAGVDVPVPGT